MTTDCERRTVLKAGAALFGATMLPASAQAADGSRAPAHEFMVKDLVYHTVGGKPRLARLYQPAGNGGAWNAKDRTDGQNTALDLAAAGIVVLAIDFHNAPEAPYPASLQDINYGIRWLKAHAAAFGSSAAQVGAYGTSNEHPFDPNSVKALHAVTAFIKTHGAERHAQR